MPVFTRDQVLQLAPDSASASAGQQLASPRKWGNLGQDERSLWGECQGSGAKPYQVQVDLGGSGGPAYKCSCPSRKIPCKHVIGLMLMTSAGVQEIAPGTPPAWVAEWLGKREERAEKKAEAVEEKKRAFDPAKAAVNRAKRIDKARAGFDDLDRWIRDLVQSGLAQVPTRGFDYFDAQARRMVDAGAPGVARMIGRLGSLASSGRDWHRPFAETLGLLRLLYVAVQRLDALPDALRADCEAALGLTIPAEVLATLPATRDVWQVISREIELDENLYTQRCWLYGLQTARQAVVLDFAYGNAALDPRLQPGTEFDGQLTFYPGNNLRAALPQEDFLAQPLSRLTGHDTISAALDVAGAAVARNPWLGSVGLVLRGVVPAIPSAAGNAERTAGRLTLQLVDRSGQALALGGPERMLWRLVALSGGHPVDVAVSMGSSRCWLLSALADGEFHVLTPPRDNR